MGNCLQNTEYTGEALDLLVLARALVFRRRFCIFASTTDVFTLLTIRYVSIIQSY